MLGMACNFTQQARVCAAIRRELGELPDLLIRSRPFGKMATDDRTFYWGLWRKLVIGSVKVDRAVKAAVGYRDWWYPHEESAMTKYHGE